MIYDYDYDLMDILCATKQMHSKSIPYLRTKQLV